MNWLWLNITLTVAFVLAVAGIPLWLMLRPDSGAVPAGQAGLRAAKVPADHQSPGDRATDGQAAAGQRGVSTETEAWILELAGASR